jgi:RNA polymerase sigma factor (sigma-70 family)
MGTQPLGEALRYLHQITRPLDDSRLDAELIGRFVESADGAAFACLVERHGPLVLGVCRRVLQHHHDAEDALQATFLVLARQARHIRERDALAGWLYKVAYRLSLKLRASAERRRKADQGLPSSRPAMEGEITWSDLRLALDEELDRLPEKYRAPLLLCCLAGRTRDEAAAQLGWSLGTLKLRLERGRQVLRRRLARRGLTVTAGLLAVLLAQQASANPLPSLLATSTVRASLSFAAGEAPAGMSVQAVTLAGTWLLGSASKVKLVGALVVLLLTIGMAIGLLALPRTPQSPPTQEVDVAANPVLPAINRFTDATDETGLTAMLKQQYARFPDWHPSGATLLDIDGDGHLDLHLAGQCDYFATLGRNVRGRFSVEDPRVEIPRGPRHQADLPYPGGEIRHAFDFNEDGKLDLAISWHNNGATMYHNAPSRAGLRFRRAAFVDPEFPDVRASALADVNGDGIVDFITSSATDINIHLGKGNGTFNAAPNAVIPAGLLAAGAIPVDLDGDGKPELIARQTDFDLPARRKIFRNTGPLKWANATREMGLSEEGSIHGVGDVNRDGHPDLICMEGQKIVIYLNDGKGRFTRKADAIRGLERASYGPHETWGDRWGGAVVVDFDNDGVPDIIINGRCFLYVLRGLGDGCFEYANDRWGLPDYAYADVDDGLCFGDVNGDGRLDLVMYSSEIDIPRRPLRLFLNRLTDHHWLRVQLVGKPGNASATGAKIRMFEAGKPDRLLAYEQVAVWGRQSFHSYYAARRTERHFGLGSRSAVDVSVEFYPSGRRIERKNVPANGTIVIQEQGP